MSQSTVSQSGANPFISRPLKPDGPISPDGFRFNGREIFGLADDWLKVLTFVWEHRVDPPKLSDVITHIHAKDRIAFDKLLDRIRKKLKGKKWPETLEVFNGCLMLRKPERESKAKRGREQVKMVSAKVSRSVRTKPAKASASKAKKTSAKQRETRGGKK